MKLTFTAWIMAAILISSLLATSQETKSFPHASIESARFVFSDGELAFVELNHSNEALSLALKDQFPDFEQRAFATVLHAEQEGFVYERIVEPLSQKYSIFQDGTYSVASLSGLAVYEDGAGERTGIWGVLNAELAKNDLWQPVAIAIPTANPLTRPLMPHEYVDPSRQPEISVEAINAIGREGAEVLALTKANLVDRSGTLWFITLRYKEVNTGREEIYTDLLTIHTSGTHLRHLPFAGHKSWTLDLKPGEFDTAPHDGGFHLLPDFNADGWPALFIRSTISHIFTIQEYPARQWVSIRNHYFGP